MKKRKSLKMMMMMNWMINAKVSNMNVDQVGLFS